MTNFILFPHSCMVAFESERSPPAPLVLLVHLVQQEYGFQRAVLVYHGLPFP
jgi:hypothetical protein